MQEILVIDDDIYIGDMLEEALNKEGYGVLRAYSGTEALLVVERKKPDLILLDLMLPGLSGEELLPKIKDIPVIVVSAKADVADKVGLLMAGACDYVTKPFNIAELTARIAVQLRMAQSKGDAAALTFGDLTLHCDTLTAAINGEEVRLTRTECAILKLLMQNPNTPVGRTTILDKISIDTPDCTERSLKQHISNMRKKLEAVNGHDYIEAVYGIGFKMR
ncbi:MULTISPECIES: response regulator transcription factor [Ruminococcus]|uniref:Stage 0 sporulation protein A homolog n=1 Tax=Ruminococcus albus 8 TaxID=246199 RepID=E9SDX4_RUMAL|nr:MULTISPECIES: response regulator transcription factor [Ruminococcus]EGC02515.1 putative response regulator MprA [Ruminococcus albus 8]MBO5558432.1 response regulator transcription factor [Ruminococcus sp.]MBQ9542596.1 response regulator transcription factor [Ruminococcus sp.]MBR0530711.1 response regulator transcription factor [Ruminococcus sp.]MCC3350833.1 response regulator transcription factor [Ruminococcus albus 8]